MSLKTFQKVKKENLKYFPGHPRVYRFNAKKGQFYTDQDEPMGRAGTPITVIPLSYRTFEAEMFGMDRREWVELFFLNEAGHVSCLLLHRYSAGEFAGLAAKLFYAEVTPVQIQLHIRPETRSHAEYGKYYIATFGFEALPAGIQKLPTKLVAALPPVYRRITAVNTENQLTWLGYPDLTALDLTASITKSLAPEKEAKAA
jgi:hypothetical protein